MTRRQFIGRFGAAAASLLAFGSRGIADEAAKERPVIEPLKKTNDEWRSILEPERFHILFREGTEAPHSSSLNSEKRAGTFHCAACFLPLFDAKTKYDSGTGWPSFYDAIKGAVRTKTDYKLIWPRTEYHCARCSGHQGHIFDDGPAPTGKRYCNNGLALVFVAEDETAPALQKLTRCPEQPLRCRPGSSTESADRPQPAR